MHKIRKTATYYEGINVEYSFVLDDELLCTEQLSFKVNVVIPFNKSILKSDHVYNTTPAKPNESNSAKFPWVANNFSASQIPCQIWTQTTLHEHPAHTGHGGCAE